MNVLDKLESFQQDPFALLGDDRQKATIMRQSMIVGNLVSFMYDDKMRLVEVHAIGRSVKDNSPVMRGFMPADGRPWRLFTLAKVDGLALDVERSEAPREGYAMDDKQMSVVLCQIKL